MFAPKVAKAQTKAVENPTSTLAPRRSTLAGALFLQRTIGNQATLRLLARQDSSLTGDGQSRDQAHETIEEGAMAETAPRGVSWDFSKISLFSPERASRSQGSSPQPRIIQPKLAIGQVNDPLEQEADRVADQVMRMPDPNPPIAPAPAHVSRKCAGCEEEEKAQKLQAEPARTAKAGREVPSIVREVVRSPGQPLDAVTRARFEPLFDHDFGRVRVHSDARAAESAQAVNALAYTVGKDIVFGAGRYIPETTAGKRLLAHELTHVVQNARGEPGTAPLAHATLRRDVNKDFPEAPPKTTSKPVVHPPLSNYNDSDPKHDPSLLTDAQIKVTVEYQDLSTKTYPPRKAPVSEQVALLACRLMLRRMRETSLVAVSLMSDAASFLDQAERQAGTLAETEKQVGHLGWVPFSTGAAVSAPSALPTEFGRWVLAGGPMPDKMSGKVNCWEMVLFGAYKAGYISFPRIKQIYDEAVANVKSGKALLVGTTVEAKLRQGKENVFDPSNPDSPAPLPGDLVIFKEAATHVAIATGTVTAGKHEVISLWNQPGNISTVQRTSIEDLLAVVGSSGRPVKFWSANW